MHLHPLDPDPGHHDAGPLTLPRRRNPVLLLTALAGLLASASTWAISDREAALLAGDGDVRLFLTWFSAVGAFCLVDSLLLAATGARLWRRQQREATASPDHAELQDRAELPGQAELSVGACLIVAVAIASGALAVAIALAATLAWSNGLFATSSESGPLERLQMAGWIISALVAGAAGFRVRDRDARSLLLLLAGGAMLVAAREADLHEKLNSDVIGAWGVHYRRDWWLSSTAPVLPRIVWAIVGLIIFSVGAYVAWRAALAMFFRGSRQGRLVWVLAAAALFMVVGYTLDDLLRYTKGINLRQSQVCEETVETAAMLTYVCAIAWSIRLSRQTAADSTMS